MEEKYIACITLAALGDIIGYNNGLYEFNEYQNFSQEEWGENFIDIGTGYSNQIVFDFINQGGFSQFPIDKLVISDDTIFHLTIIQALIDKFDNHNKLLALIQNNMINTINTPEKKKDMIDVRAIGNVTLNSLLKLEKGMDWHSLAYDPKAGGTGGCMRSMCIGLAYHKLVNRLDLVKLAIDSCRITHNNAIGYLGSFASALFVALAIENIDPQRWIYELIDILESNLIDSHIKTNYPQDYEKYNDDKLIFLNKWKQYLDIRFQKHQFIERKIMTIPSERSKFFHDKFSNLKKVVYPGAGGDDSVIIAYDAFLESKGNWEKLVVYSMLHVGDSDTTGSIAGAFFGAYYGFKNVTKKMLKKFSLKEDFIMYGKKLYNKYYRE